MLSNTLTIVVNVLLANVSGFLICKLKFGLFILSGVFLLIITIIICLLIPKTTDVLSNEMIERVFRYGRNIRFGGFVFLLKVEQLLYKLPYIPLLDIHNKKLIF